jgi:hypothetical protein
MKSTKIETEVRSAIHIALANLKREAAPTIYDLIQTENGYKYVENEIVIMMCKENFTASACIPHLNDML